MPKLKLEKKIPFVVLDLKNTKICSSKNWNYIVSCWYMVIISLFQINSSCLTWMWSAPLNIYCSLNNFTNCNHNSHFLLYSRENAKCQKHISSQKVTQFNTKVQERKAWTTHLHNDKGWVVTCLDKKCTIPHYCLLERALLDNVSKPDNWICPTHPWKLCISQTVLV